MTSNPAQPRNAPSQPGLIPAGSGSPRPSRNGASRLSEGLLITFEGGEGAGKTTQSTRLANRIANLGIETVRTREPGGTELGEQIRSWVKRESDISPTAELLLFAAARAQLVSEIIKPSLGRNAVVIVDRFVDSTVAYQGYGRGMDLDQINSINRAATSGVAPDLTVLLDAEPGSVLERVDTTSGESGDSAASRDGDRVDERRFENEPISYHRKVRQGYRELARSGGRWSVIKADQAQHRVADAIWKRVRPLLIERGVDPELLFRRQGSQDE